ncbi:hypothetical protein CYMTET_47437 [Cymbomonas tetramitiformis]|uniref:Sugar phosphate transporter domain-containing protein n=1 Tax=Cymbomonas tetramitiformis TaxID=36881 RepID=A0AAE0BVB2_9CHLO|nr:hypothetical protein CYMTET_47437 [Cymbomonas tetramitiformis]
MHCNICDTHSKSGRPYGFSSTCFTFCVFILDRLVFTFVALRDLWRSGSSLVCRLSDEEVSAVIHNSRLQVRRSKSLAAKIHVRVQLGQLTTPHRSLSRAVFMLSSSSLLLVNKGALKSIPLPFFITLVQVLSTVCILHVLRVCKTVQFDDLSRHVAKDWFVVSVVWLAPIVFNMFALRRLNAESVIVFRAASTAGVALADWIFFKHGFQANETLGVVAIVGGSVLYTSFDLQYDATGYVLGLVYMISMIFNLIYIKYFFEQNQSLNMWTKTYYMNMLAIPLLIVMVLAFEGSAVGELSWSSISNSGLVCLGVSCLVGLVLSASATGLRDVVSPTTFDILGNVNKFATAALSRLIFHTVNTALSSLGLAISLLGGALYAPIGKQLFGLSDAATQPGVSDTAQPGRSKALLAAVILLAVTSLSTTYTYVSSLNSQSQAQVSSSTTVTTSQSTRRHTFVNHERSFQKFKWPLREELPSTRQISRHQNPEDCKKAKFMVYPFPHKQSTRNIGSIYGPVGYWLAFAIHEKRVLLFDDRDWPLGDCPTKNSECYFLPISKCKVEDLDALPAKEKYIMPNVDAYHTAPQQARVWHVPDAWWPGNGKDVIETTLWPGNKYRHKCHFWKEAILYLFQLQPWIKEEIARSMELSFPPSFDPKRAISMPIRASDHCQGHTLEHSSPGEYDCSKYTIERYMALAEEIRSYDSDVDTILLSSEDQKVVERGLKEYSDRWNILWNKKDVMQGTGSATGLTQTANHSLTISEVLVSALSTMHFQLRSRYFIPIHRSAYNLLIAYAFQHDSVTFTDNRMLVPLVSDGLDFKRNLVC